MLFGKFNLNCDGPIIISKYTWYKMTTFELQDNYKMIINDLKLFIMTINTKEFI